MPRYNVSAKDNRCLKKVMFNTTNVLSLAWNKAKYLGVYMYINIYIDIYIYTERERERKMYI